MLATNHMVAAAFMLKPIESRSLIEFVTQAEEANLRQERGIANILSGWSRRYDLTPTERKILAAATTQRVPRKRLAASTGSGEETVKTHVHHLIVKTGHTTLSDAALALVREALFRKP